MAIADYGARDALELADLVRRREASAGELLEEAIARNERVNPKLGAVVTALYDDARRAAAALPTDAAGPFAGVPFLVKDIYADMVGVPATSCSRFLAGYTPPRDATIVERLRRAGLIIFGRTNAPELGLLPVTEPELYGPTRNPWDPARTPGGSSGGAAAAVAAGIVPLAHANDGGGSIRIPASCCGLFGLKPTRARTPAGPDHSQLWNGFTIAHAVSRTVRDSAALLDAIAGPEPTSPYWAPPQARTFLEEVGAPPGKLRIALTKRPQVSAAALHPDCAAAADDAARLFAELGHQVEEAEPDIDAEAFARDFFTLVCVETAAFLARAQLQLGRRPRRGELESATAITALLGRQRSAVEAARARERLDAVARKTLTFFERYDLLLSPTLATPPPMLGALKPRGLEAFGQELLLGLHLGFLLRIPGIIDASVRRVFSFIPFSPLANVTGQPAMTVPLHLERRRPADRQPARRALRRRGDAVPRRRAAGGRPPLARSPPADPRRRAEGPMTRG